jgi:hypothetical protein
MDRSNARSASGGELRAADRHTQSTHSSSLLPITSLALHLQPECLKAGRGAWPRPLLSFAPRRAARPPTPLPPLGSPWTLARDLAGGDGCAASQRLRAGGSPCPSSIFSPGLGSARFTLESCRPVSHELATNLKGGLATNLRFLSERQRGVLGTREQSGYGLEHAQEEGQEGTGPEEREELPQAIPPPAPPGASPDLRWNGQHGRCGMESAA